MKQALTALWLLPCLFAGPVQAGLTIESLEIAASAQVQTSSSGNQRVDLFDDHPFGLPFVLSANAQVGTQTALAQQGKDGFFQNRAVAGFGFGSGAGQRVFASAVTSYALTVGTSEADTPLILDFNVYGSQARGAAYYAEGGVAAYTGIEIGAAKNAVSGVVAPIWGFSDRVSLAGGLFSISRAETDVQGIGLPTATGFVGWEEFQLTARAERGSFAGTLDFGLLQPGETFTLIYQSFSTVDMRNVLYGGSALATLVDPFALGGDPPLTLRGLTLPTAPVPEPQTWALMLAGLALLVLRLTRLRAMGRP